MVFAAAPVQIRALVPGTAVYPAFTLLLLNYSHSFDIIDLQVWFSRMTPQFCGNPVCKSGCLCRAHCCARLFVYLDIMGDLPLIMVRLLICLITSEVRLLASRLTVVPLYS